MLLNLIILRSARKYHYSSTMANIIGRSHKLGKQNRKRPDVINDISNAKSSTSRSHDMFNENIDIETKEYLSAETSYG